MPQPHHRARVCFLTGLIVAALVVSGCGSSNSSSTTTAAAATGTASATSTATSASETISSDLGRLPGAPNATGTLPAPPASTTVDPSYLRAVFNDAQQLWEREFRQSGLRYGPAQLTLFSRAVHSGCGPQTDVGPFYCGASRGIYLDLNFFDLLARQAGVGRFSQAYIVGHEFGHHV